MKSTLDALVGLIFLLVIANLFALGAWLAFS